MTSDLGEAEAPPPLAAVTFGKAAERTRAAQVASPPRQAIEFISF
jgi:hypothetical protein